MKPDASRSRWPGRIRLRLGLTLAAISLLALGSMGISIYVAETARGDAAAINDAGSLRMQSYRIASMLQTDAPTADIAAAARQFEAILGGASLRAPLREDSVPAERYSRVQEQWHTRLAPTLPGPDTPDALDKETYLARVDGFVDSVHVMVQAFQEQAETRIQFLRWTQAIAIGLTVALILAAMALLHRRVARPLQDLMAAADRAGDGDLTVRARHVGDDEIGVLGRSFNLMAGSLQHLHADLEQQVENKTLRLRRSNDALRLLYDAARALAPGHLNRDTVMPILGRLTEITEWGPARVCISQPDGTVAIRTFDDGTRETSPAYCSAPQCGPCLAGCPRAGSEGCEGLAAFPLEYRAERHGVLLLEYPRGTVPEAWKRRLAEAVADQLALAHGLEREARQQRRVSLLEERAVIARELHDSLAQSLSYLKIQVVRLESLLRAQSPGEETGKVVSELREGLNTAYGHLRELLTTFRLRMNEPGLEAALSSTMSEFRKRAEHVDFELEIPETLPGLDSNAEIHILQIVREALANVIHHSGATRTRVALTTRPEGEIHLCVEDNGRGLPENPDRAHHFGLRIMDERARSLGGVLAFDTAAPQGTRLEVRFPPRTEGSGETGKATA